MTKARDTANIVGGGFSGTIAGATMEPTGDTAAGDNAAIGFTAAEGLILTGQGSTGDVTIKNDADALVAHVPTGTTGITFAGTPTFPDGSIAVADLDIDGGTDIGAALVDADLMIVDDGAGGTNRKATMARLATYMGTKITGGSMVFIASSGVLDDVANVQFRAQDGHFDATKFDHYVFWFQHVIPVTDNVEFLARTSTNDGSAYASTDGDYHLTADGDRTGLNVAFGVGSAAGEYGVSGEFLLLSPHTTSAFTYGTAAGIVCMNLSSQVQSNNSYPSARLAAEDTDAVQFIFASGNIESGEIVMYGIANGT